jgi:two-component system, NtrC family, response regulator GlrR
LRERHGDVRLLLTHFAQQYCDQEHKQIPVFDEAALAWFDSYPWPGNIRELENLVYRTVLLGDNNCLQCLPTHPRTSDRRRVPDRRWPLRPGISLQTAKQEVLHAFEYRYLEWALAQTRGNITHAAALAQTERRMLGKLVQKYGIDPTRYR